LFAPPGFKGGTFATECDPRSRSAHLRTGPSSSIPLTAARDGKQSPQLMRNPEEGTTMPAWPIAHSRLVSNLLKSSLALLLAVVFAAAVASETGTDAPTGFTTPTNCPTANLPATLAQDDSTEERYGMTIPLALPKTDGNSSSRQPKTDGR